MIRTTNFDALVAECTSIEQIVALGMFALYDRSYPSNFITTGIASDGTDIRSRKAQVWTGNQIVAENTMEEQTVMTLALPIALNSLCETAMTTAS